jgi:hypothetical protein
MGGTGQLYAPGIKVLLDQHRPSFLVFAWGTVGTSANSFVYVFKLNSTVNVCRQFINVRYFAKHILIFGGDTLRQTVKLCLVGELHFS